MHDQGAQEVTVPNEALGRIRTAAEPRLVKSWFPRYVTDAEGVREQLRRVRLFGGCARLYAIEPKEDALLVKIVELLDSLIARYAAYRRAPSWSEFGKLRRSGPRPQLKLLRQRLRTATQPQTQKLWLSVSR